MKFGFVGALIMGDIVGTTGRTMTIASISASVEWQRNDVRSAIRSSELSQCSG
ncbi:hypothetical protein FD14_GL001747 [Secundilactobacillus similis DSM 23365 = JCM 2765]|uniref:Uncharacterized protein n=1 Tax=Secundilactobacillus similis DSM 23365 = JCM 2765 TaxID=1423804 RepID=A0A0R2F1I8_9LACO|nr:hypothetical protein FD14_GL001747 [Secundilactobacillus similis DSM 23365 = JCM 2765]